MTTTANNDIFAVPEGATEFASQAFAEAIKAEPIHTVDRARLATVDRTRRLERCMAYLEKADRAVSGSGGHNAFLWASRVCVRFDLDEQEHRKALQWFSENKSDPPWSDREIDHKVSDARRVFASERGLNLLQTHTSPCTRSGSANGSTRNADTDTTPEIPKKNELLSVSERAHGLDYEPFPLDALPEPMRSFVAGGAAALGCDAAFVAVPTLAALASAIGNTRRVELKRGWTEPAIVWAAIVGDSGTLKSPALELALRPLRRRQAAAMNRHAEAMALHRDELARYERDAAAWKRGKGNGDPPHKPDEPAAERCWCDDTTIEGLAALLAQNWRGLLVACDELAGWLGGFDRYAQASGGDAPKWLSMFGGRPLLIDRKTGTPRTIFIPHASISICGGIQPATLARSLGVEHRENGMAARLLVTCPPRVAKRWTEAEPDPAIEAAVGEVFDRLFELHPGIDHEGEPFPLPVPLTAEAKRRWIVFYNEHAREHAELVGELSAAWSKLEGYAARFALVLHYARWAAGDADGDAIDAASIAAGVRLSRWFGHEARRVYRILAEGDDGRARRRLVELIATRGGTITARELMRASGTYGTADAADAALNDLVKVGLGHWSPVNAATGRPTRRFILSRADDTDTTPKSPKKNGLLSDEALR